MRAKVVWLTGLSGAGKSTISKLLAKLLKNEKNKVKIVDGDIFRKNKKIINKFSKKNIIYNNNLIIDFVKKLINSYDYLIVAAISPLLKTRIKAKKIFRQNYFEVLIYCKISTLEKRDTKGLYKKAKKKLIKNLIGYNSNIKYENSKYKKIQINTDVISSATAAKFIYKKLRTYYKSE